MAVITISRQFGAGGMSLGRKVADMLDYSFFDEEIIQLVAQKARVSPDWVRSIEKEAGGKLHKLINTLIPRNVVDRILDDQRGYIDEEIYVDLLIQIVTKVAEEDNAVILGRGGQYILKGRPGVFHVLLVADMDHRVGFVEAKYNLTPSQATQSVYSQDKKRINLYRKFNKTDYDRPDHYHLTLNMSKISLNKAAELVKALIA
jgi:cytidylate kinase